jgi:hypothetical protein
MVDNKKIQSLSGEILSGGDIKSAIVQHGATEEHLKASRILVDQVRQAPKSKTTLYRGLSTEKEGTWLDTIKVGEDVSMGRLTSFSASREKAALYSEKSSGIRKYELRIEGTSQSFATDKLTGMEHLEHLTDGDFKVIKISGEERVKWGSSKWGPARNIVKMKRVITLRQVGVF